MKVFAFLGLLLLCPRAGFTQTPAPAPVPPAAPKSQVGQSTYEEIESVWSLSAFYWKTQGADNLLAGGARSTDPPAQTSALIGKPKYAPGAILTVPTGHSNRLEFQVWQAQSRGSFKATRAYTFFAESFRKEDLLVTETRVRNAKMTWNYLSLPYPALDSKFRVKTLWEFQYVQVNPTITAPLTATVAVGATPASPAKRVAGKRTLLMPTLGLAMEWVPSSKHFRVDARGTAMSFRSKGNIWDLEGNATLRLWNLEVFGGAKMFHYRTTKNNEQYLEGNLWGPVAGVRWVFR